MAENKCGKGGCCGELDDETHPSSIMMMRIFSVLAVIFSVVEFGLGGAATGFLIDPEASIGVWWVGLCPIAIGICGMITKNRGGVIAIIILGSFAMLIAVAGAILDSYRLSELSSLKTCVKVDKKYAYSISGATDDTSVSAVNAACLYRFNDYTVPKDRCLCTSSENTNCNIFHPNSKYACDDVMVTLPSVLKASIAMCSIIAFCSIVLAAVGCSIVCCTGTAKKEKTTTDPEVQPDNIVIGVDSNPKAY